MRHNYLRDHHRGIFDWMLLTDRLNAHLEEVDRQANEMMAWVAAMNNIKNRAEEIVLNDLIYA